jgi:glutathione S-transferase
MGGDKEAAMIMLYTFGPAFGLPDPSPFVMKAEVLLKMAGLPYRTGTGGLRKAPKRKLPYLDDDGTHIADSTLIRFHLETKYGIDFDLGLSADQRATAWVLEKMAEDHLYWALVDARWLDNDNFAKGPARAFRKVPAPMRPFVIALVRRKIRSALWAQGTGRHARDEIVQLTTRSIDAMAQLLGQKPFFFGAEPCGADATMFAFTAGLLCPRFATPLRDAAERHDNLKRYVGRMTARYYPDFAEIAGCRAAA